MIVTAILACLEAVEAELRNLAVGQVAALNRPDLIGPKHCLCLDQGPITPLPINADFERHAVALHLVASGDLDADGEDLVRFSLDVVSDGAWLFVGFIVSMLLELRAIDRDRDLHAW